ncbi:MAG: alkaline phosphatase family protein [Theionarchaea archaeon]|nr:alkaline phosphatase family protein [Theionarchaea archaeon]
MKKYAILIIPLVLAFASSYIQGVAEGAYDTFANGTSFFQSSIQEGNQLEPATQFAVIIVNDSLRYKDSLELKTLNTLREDGADFLSHVGQPSYSLPGYVTIPTGAFPEITGVTSNYYEGAPIDNIFRAAKDAGLTTAIVSGSDSWKKLFGDYVDVCYSYSPDRKELDLIKETNLNIKEKSIEVIETCKPHLFLIHFSGTDEASHKYGGNSSEYKEVAVQQDTFIAEILEHYNLDETVVFITSDHGHIDKGGHGGWEEETLTVPLVMYGAPINPGIGEAVNTDIAPTVAAVLGIRIPTHSQGRILLNGLDVADRIKASWMLQLAEQRRIFSGFYLGVLGAEIMIDVNYTDAVDFFNEEDYQESLESSEKSINTSAHLMEEAKKEKITGERLRRVPFFLAIVGLPLVIGFFAIRRKWITKRMVYIAAICGISYIFLFNIIFFVTGNTYSLSTINDDPDIGPFFNMMALLGVLLPLIIMAFAGGYLRKEKKFEIVMYCWIASAVISYIMVVQLGFHYLLQDNGISWYMPNMLLGFKYYVDAMQFVPLGYTSLLHPFVGLISAIVVVKLRK